MQSSFLFKTATITQEGGAGGQVFRLDRVVADLEGDRQSRFRLVVFCKGPATTGTSVDGEHVGSGVPRSRHTGSSHSGGGSAGDSPAGDNDEVPLFTLELSEAEAFTFSEWLDSAVTSCPPEDDSV